MLDGKKPVKKLGIVTGAAKGIGRAIALKLAENSYDLVLNYRTSDKEAKETKKACENLGARVVLVQADLSLEEDSKRLIDKAYDEFKRIDLLVNNAGITRDKLIVRMKLEDFKRVQEANLESCFNCSKEASRIMSKQRFGNIINISSVVGIRGNIGQANYAASKAGVIGLSKSLAKELARRNIRVNVVAPGFIDTDMTQSLTNKEEIYLNIPLKRMGKAEDIAEAVMFLASDSSSYITGQVLSVDGGMNI